MPRIFGKPRVCNLAFWRCDGSTSKSAATLMRARQAILPMVLGESWVSLKNPETRKSSLSRFTGSSHRYAPCKSESLQKPVPVHPILSEALLYWRKGVRYTRTEDWVFASRRYQVRKPYCLTAWLFPDLNTRAMAMFFLPDVYTAMYIHLHAQFPSSGPGEGREKTMVGSVKFGDDETRTRDLCRDRQRCEVLRAT
jgi:hypothetical protein